MKKKHLEHYIIKGMTDLALEYDQREPHFICEGTSMWVVDDHNIVSCDFHADVEDWFKLLKEYDVWYMIERKPDNMEKSKLLSTKGMDIVDEALASYIIERELLDND